MTANDRAFLVVEDDLRLQQLIATALRPPGWRPLFAARGADALKQLGAGGEPPAVAVVDLGLPDMDGVTLIEKMTRARADLPIVVLSVCTEEHRILQAIRTGARGYIFKEDLGGGLGAALDEALAGGAPMSRAVARLVLRQLRNDQTRNPRTGSEPPAMRSVEQSSTSRDAKPQPVPALTDRERQVVEQLARGLSYDQVAMVLEISANTVRTYVRTIYDKLCVCSKTEAVMTALRLGIIASVGDV